MSNDGVGSAFSYGISWNSVSASVENHLDSSLLDYERAPKFAPFNAPFVLVRIFSSYTLLQILAYHLRVSENRTVDIFSDHTTNEIPDRELYIRWLELATFLPVIRFSHLPSQYDKDVVDLAKNLTALRQQKVWYLPTQYKCTRTTKPRQH